MEADKNHVYCPSLLFVWDNFIEIFEAEAVAKNELIQQLDDSNEHINALDKGEYKNTISVEGEIIEVHSEFSKSLPFEVAFDRNRISLNFEEKQMVESFGCVFCERELKDQIEVLFFKSQRDFALKLLTQNDENEILLYRSPRRRKSLKAYYDDLLKKRNEKKNKKEWWRYSFLSEDVFAAPVLKFNIEAQIEELLGVIFYSNLGEIQIDDARQRIALAFDEKGAEIETEAYVSVKAADAERTKIIPKNLIFDEPYLIAFKKKNFENPYLLLWVDNTELMKPMDKNKEENTVK